MKTRLIAYITATAAISQAQNNFKYLDINNVKAGIGNRGIMHYNPATIQASYEVPTGSGIHSDFNSALWIGGYDNSNTLHLAAQTYRQFGDDFWPGPLDTTNAAISAATSNQYDRIWKLNQSDINAFITNFNNGNVQNGSYTPVADLLSWPAQGTGTQSRNLAPFMDKNHNHVYDPMTGGDYPIIKGDQSLYYIFNDNLNHANTGAAPMKVEVHATAYAYGNSATASQYAFLSNATFYNYKIINRSSQDYHDAFVSLFTDVDLGYYGDDYIGCDVGGNYGYVYNADNNDESVGVNGYGTVIPAAGYQVLKGGINAQDSIDNNNDGIIDEPCETMGMTRFNYFNNTVPGAPVDQFSPQNAAEFYNYMSGFWRGGTPFTCGGNGYGGTTATPFIYPGTTYTNSDCGPGNWSEITAGNIPNDRRYVIGTGPFTIQARSSFEIDYVHCTSFPTGSNSALQQLKTDMGLLRNFYGVYHASAPCTMVSMKEQDHHTVFSIYPNPAASEINLTFDNNSPASIEILDMYGKVILQTTNDYKESIHININTLASGIYFVKVSADGKSSVKKFMKN